MGVVGSTPTTLDDGGAVAANAGLGARLFLTDAIYLGLDGRYRYIDKLVKQHGKELNTVETTLAVGGPVLMPRRGRVGGSPPASS